MPWAVVLAATFFAPRAWQPIVQVVYVVLLTGFVASFGLAILKYRLYDIDFVISRAVVYGALAVSIGVV